ncbi:MAG: hypothetical protein QW103_01480 [Candidatus Pacearchaeota archaeon]
MVKRKSISKNKKEKKIKLEVINKEEEKKDKEENQRDVFFEFVPLQEAEKKIARNISLEEDVSFQEQEFSNLDSLFSSFIEEEKRKNNENPYFSKKEDIYSIKKDDRNYSSPSEIIRPIVQREKVEIRNVNLSSNLTTLSTFPKKRDMDLIRMPNQQETYQQDMYKIYETERFSPDDLNRKTKENRNIDFKYTNN